MFNSSKYTKYYNNIISRAISRNWTKKTAPCYVEKHHIIPKSCGGLDIHENLVYLTAKEHFIVHHLLTKMVIDIQHKFKMLCAFWRMVNGKSTHKKITANLYEKYKTNHSIASKGHFTGVKLFGESNPMYGNKRFSGANNPMYGKQGAMLNKKHSIEAKEKNRKAHLGKKHSNKTRHLMSMNRKLEKHPNAKYYIIKNIINNTEEKIFCLSKWCLENNLNYNKIKMAAHKGHITKENLQIIKVCDV